MKHYRKELHFHLKTKTKICNITKEITDALSESRIKEGILLVNAMNTTASVFVNDEDGGLFEDYKRWLENLAPQNPEKPYAHKGSRENADAHLKRSIMGREAIIAVTQGQLDLGVWEQIFYFEFDGNRDKRVLIKIIGD